MAAPFDPRKAQALVQALRAQSMPTPSATLSDPGAVPQGLVRPAATHPAPVTVLLQGGGYAVPPPRAR